MQPLLLLHGAVGASVQLGPLAGELKSDYNVHVLNFSGHGGTPFADAPFSIELFAGEVLSFMEGEQIGKVSIFGYSMGGYVGLYLARHYPEKIEKVITLGTKFQWSEEIAAKEVQMLHPEKIEQKVPAFAASLRKMHAPNDWKAVLDKTAGMMAGLGRDNALKPEDYAAINTPVLLLVGQKDKMVSYAETHAVQQLIPGAQMAELPDTPHPVEQVSVSTLSGIIRSFLA